VVLADVNAELGQGATKALQDDGLDVHFVACDVSSAARIENVIAETERRYGTASILLNNAAMYRSIDFLQMTEAEFHRIVRTNLNPGQHAQPHPAWPPGGACRNRRARLLPGQRRRKLCHRADDLRRWRPHRAEHRHAEAEPGLSECEPRAARSTPKQQTHVGERQAVNGATVAPPSARSRSRSMPINLETRTGTPTR